MYIKSKKEEHVLGFIKEFGMASLKQLICIAGATPKVINALLHKKYIKKQDALYYYRKTEKDEKLFKCLEVLKHFGQKTDWYRRVKFPFYIIMFMNEKVFHITYVQETSEALMSAAINASDAERVIVAVDNSEIIKKLHISKPVKYCTINPFKFIE